MYFPEIIMLMFWATGSEVFGAYTQQDVIECQKIAQPIPADYKPNGELLKWWIDKVTPLTVFPQNLEPPDQNVCTTFSFLESQNCDSIFSEAVYNPDKSRSIRIRAESKKYNNVLEYLKTNKIVDQTHFIFSGEVSDMKIYPGPNQQATPIDVPDFVKQTQDQLVALVDSVNAKYQIFATCTGTVAWSVISPTVEQSNERDEIYAKIDASIRRLKLQFKHCMKEVDKELLFNIPA